VSLVLNRKSQCWAGLLLDLDSQCVTVYKNDVRLGEISERGVWLTGDYCWAVTMPTHVTVRVEAAPVPEAEPNATNVVAGGDPG
jgi:hypothetical protein